MLKILRGIAVVMDGGLATSSRSFSALARMRNAAGSMEGVGRSSLSSCCFRIVMEKLVINHTSCSQVSRSLSASLSRPHILLADRVERA